SVRAEGYLLDGAGAMTDERWLRLSRLRIQHVDLPGAGGDRERLAVRTEGQGVIAGRLRQGGDGEGLTASRVPHDDAAVVADRGEAPAVRTKGDYEDGFRMTGEVEQFVLRSLRLTGSGIPQPHGAVRAGGGQLVAVRTDGQAAHRVGVAPQRQRLLAGRQVPGLHRLVLAGREQTGAVRAEGQPEARLGGARKTSQEDPGGGR